MCITNEEKKILVIGAGATGLSAAWTLAEKGFRPIVLEQENQVGGLGNGRRFGANIYEYGPHLFHSNSPEILSRILKLMGDELFINERIIHIKYRGKLLRFPLILKDLLLNIPFSELIPSLISQIYYMLRSIILRPALNTSEDILIHRYGKRLYNDFFRQYTKDVWGIWPSEFSAAFAVQRVPRIDTINLIKKVWEKSLKKHTDPEKLIEKVAGKVYYTCRGLGQIYERMAEEIAKHGGEIRLNTKLLRVHVNNNRVDKVVIRNSTGKEETLKVRAVISTIPITSLIPTLFPAVPEEVINAAKSLQYKALAFAGFLINKPFCLEALFTLYRNRMFNRLTDEARFKMAITPEGSTIVIAEVSCDKGDKNWLADESFLDRVQAELEEEGVFANADVLERHAYTYEWAYPVYKLGFEQHLAIISQYFKSIQGFTSTGRQGGFLYINTHVAMEYGYKAAQELFTRNT
jgi:protoporphyrinogen oxidase